MNVASWLPFSFGPAALPWPTELIYQFPKATWLENLAVRPDGSILTTVVTSPDLYLVQPYSQKPHPELVHTFEGSSSAVGITEETTPDSFQVGTVSITFDNLAPVPGSARMWRVQFPKDDVNPRVTLTAKLPDMGLPNGMTTLNDHTILVADSNKGNIVAVDTGTGSSTVIISDPLLTNTEQSEFAVNGLKLHGNTLYFTNSGRNILGKVQVDPETGAPGGPLTVIVHGPEGPGTVAYDDFSIDAAGRKAYLTTVGGNSVARVDLETGKQDIVAGDLNSTEIAQPTAAVFGRGSQSGVLFVSTAGGLGYPVNGNLVVGGQLVAVTVDEVA